MKYIIGRCGRCDHRIYDAEEPGPEVMDPNNRMLCEPCWTREETHHDQTCFTCTLE